MSSSYSANIQSLFKAFERLKIHLECYVDSVDSKDINEKETAGPSSSDELELALQDVPSITTLARKFQLSVFEQCILLLMGALELEPHFQSLCAQAQSKSSGNDHQPYATLGLALSVFPKAGLFVLSPESPLHYWQLIQAEPGRFLTQSPIAIDRRILCYILGESALPNSLSHLVTRPSSNSVGVFSQDATEPDTQETYELGHTPLPPSYERVTQQMIDAWSGISDGQSLPLIGINGADTNLVEAIALTTCDRLGLQLFTLSAALLPTTPQEVKQLQRDWEREAILSNSVLLLNCDTIHASDPGKGVAIALFLETLNTPAIISCRHHKPQVKRPLITLDIPPLTHTEQTTLWHRHLGEQNNDLDDSINAHIDRLAIQFQLTPTTIQSICLQAQSHTPSKIQNRSTERSRRSPKSKINPPLAPPRRGTGQPEIQNPKSKIQNLWSLCRTHARPNLEDLAQRIEPTATWDDLVLPERQRQILQDAATHLNYRAQVYQQWGFAGKSDRGLGISALFYGESGTGKTMAAEVLAADCQLDLYRIDLSSVVSKYIGETEKNLRRIFDAAEIGGAILLFDEADSLFGKRTEVKDSHDRHANVEVSYLLQRMEAYRGLAILTSNLKDSLDKAFLRRLRFMIPFPMPDAEARAEIWQRVFPAQTPTQKLDYAKLGQLKIAGGNIRNIALNAAFIAAQSEQPVMMDHIRQAAQREYLKLERLLTTEEVRGWK